MIWPKAISAAALPLAPGRAHPNLRSRPGSVRQRDRPASDLPPPARRCCAAPPLAAAETSGAAAPPPRLQLELPTAEAQATLRFAAVRAGRGKAIIVDAVAADGAAAAAGVRPGQQLLSLSDPIRAGETWPLNERVSLRYVRDAIRMRRAPYIALELSAEPLPLWDQPPQDGAALGDPSASSSDAESELLVALAADASASASSMNSMDGGSGSEGTIGERLERRQKQAAGGMTDLERRQRRRKEYFEQSSGRNDAPFFAAVAAAFLLPAVVILGVAASTGYLDSLASGWAGR